MQKQEIRAILVKNYKKRREGRLPCNIADLGKRN